MANIVFRNSSKYPINITIEPFADRYVVQQDSAILIEYAMDNNSDLEIECHQPDEIAIYTHNFTKVYKDGILLESK